MTGLFGGSSSSGSAGDSYAGGYGSCGLLLAGTADGHVCCLDVETGALVEDFVACWEPRQPRQSPAAAAAAAGLGYYSQQQQHLLQQPQMINPLLLAGSTGAAGWEDPSSCVISAVCSSSSSSSKAGGGWLAAGSGSGRLLLLDSRAGIVLGSWQAHSQRVSQLQGLAGSRGDWQLLSCSQDKTLKLWDLRMLRHNRHWFGSSSSSNSVGFGGSLPVAAFKGTKDGIDGFVVYQDAAIAYGGANLGLAPLDSSGSSSSSVPNQQQQQQQGWSAPAAAVMRNVRMTGIRGGSARGLGSSGKASREGLGPKAASSGSAIIGLGLLQHSKLLVVGSEDGQLKICR
jgi:WD40 repeat protein